MKNVSKKLSEHFSIKEVQLLRDIGKLAISRGEAAYLVGGAVRDLIMGRSSIDIDVVIEGKAISLANHIAKVSNWDVKAHPRFGTAKLSAEEVEIDLVTARSESYSQPGVLPVVKAGTFSEDLLRRDFTINAMGVHLAPELFGDVIDPYDGQSDLKRKIIRVLHQGSFSDDPTRMLRALRYEQRLGFQLEKNTEDSLTQHLNKLDAVTGERLWRELELVLSESVPEKVLLRADKLRILWKLHTALKFDAWIEEKFDQGRKISDLKYSLITIYLVLLVYRLSGEVVEDIIVRFKMPGWAARVLRDTTRLKSQLHLLEDADLRPSGIYYILESHIPEIIEGVSMACESHIIQQRTRLFLSELRHIRTSLKGSDLQKMGVAPGKNMGRILRHLSEARIDGMVKNRQEEETFVAKML